MMKKSEPIVTDEDIKHVELVDKLKTQILEGLPDNIKLKFEVIEEYLTVKPESWLGTDGFGLVKAKIDALQGEYVSAGKYGHFRIFLGSKETSLVEWYKTQRPLSVKLVLNLNLQVTTPEQLEKFLESIKKNITVKSAEKERIKRNA